jgi:hypothetical protein
MRTQTAASDGGRLRAARMGPWTRVYDELEARGFDAALVWTCRWISANHPATGPAAHSRFVVAEATSEAGESPPALVANTR